MCAVTADIISMQSRFCDLTIRNDYNLNLENDICVKCKVKMLVSPSEEYLSNDAVIIK